MSTLQNEPPTSEKETGRLEAFSDGLFGIAITLLVLDIKVPPAHEINTGSELGAALLRQWPQYLAYVNSFVTILIMWINHHRLFRHITRTDHTLMVLNGLLLMGVTLVPFPTSLLAEYIRHPGAQVAAAVYSGAFVWIALFFNFIWHYAQRDGRLLGPHTTLAHRQAITKQYQFGPLLYLVAFALAFVSVIASISLCAVLAVYFMLPPLPFLTSNANASDED